MLLKPLTIMLRRYRKIFDQESEGVVSKVYRGRAAMEQWHECGMTYRSFFTWPTTLHSASQCKSRDANQWRDETFVHEAIQTTVSWISKWQRELLPVLSWCDLSSLRRSSVTKPHFIFAFGRYISRGLLSGWRRPSKRSWVSRIVTAEAYEQFFFAGPTEQA